jgi:nitroreductase
MNPVAITQLLESFRWRYATKQFDATRRIPDGDWHVLEEILLLAPSSFGLQPWRFITVADPALRARLRQHSWHQTQVTDASHFVVFTARTDLTAADIDRWLDRIVAIRGSLPLPAYGDMIRGFVAARSPAELHAWNARQAYLALGQLMSAAAVAGIDTCPMEGMDAAAYDRELGLTGSGYATAVACALGYRSADDKYAALPKVRYERDEIFVRR